MHFLVQDLLLLRRCNILACVCIHQRQQRRVHGVPRISLQEEEDCELYNSVSSLSSFFQAQAATMTIAQAFNLAFQSWKENQEKEQDAATMNGNCISKKQTKSNETQTLESVKNKSFGNANCDTEVANIDETHLLIDLNSPGDTLEDKTTSAFLVKIDPDETKDMDDNFSR